MVPAANLLAFALVAIPIILVPGPSVLFVIGRSLSLGKLGGLLSVLGNSLGALVSATAVALGVGYLIAESVVAFTVIKIAGAAYLIYLGIQAIRHRKVSAATAVDARPQSRSVFRLLAQGFLVGLTNPKTIVFFVAVLPQFVDYGAGGIPLQLLALGVLFIAIALLTDSAWALVAGVARDWFARSPRRIERLGATGGVLMIGLGTASLFAGHGGGGGKG
jgi:threonine/homoserine/homoserine lactone efflux protein